MFLVILGIVASSMFYAGTQYQSSADQIQLPPTYAQSTNKNLVLTTTMYSTYLNVSLVLSPKALVATSGILRVQLGSNNAWSETKNYALQPGDWQSFQFYPSIAISSVDSVTVSA